MFSYLSKKVGMPNQTGLSCIDWNKDVGWIAVGGFDGLLKIMKLEEQKQKDGGVAQKASQLPVNIALSNHQGQVHIVRWNEYYNKLTSADETGLIIVWMFHNDEWYEEMINNRNQGAVVDMNWSPDGSKIGIIYDDGNVICGSVEGSRLWGKQLEHELTQLTWSPDSSLVLFSTPLGEVKVYDNSGNYIHNIKMLCLQNLVDDDQLLTPNKPIARISWYTQAKMYTNDTPCGLCIAYECGRIQLMKNDTDVNPVLIDTTLSISKITWNPFGNIFAVCGAMEEAWTAKDNTMLQYNTLGVVQFYNNLGNHLKTLKIPNTETADDISWEGNGLRCSIAVGSAMYIANIRADYKWTYIEKTLVFGYQKQDRVEFCLIFWDISQQTKHMKYVKNLSDIKGAGELCCIITRYDEDGIEYWQVDLCDNMGSPLDSKHINIEPVCTVMTKTHIIITNNDHVYVWQYRNQVERLTTFEHSTGIRKIGRELAWFIDEAKIDTNSIYDKESYDIEKQTEDLICAATANENYLFVGRISGTIHKFTLPHIVLENKVHTNNYSRPQTLEVNNDSTILAIIDLNGSLSLLSLDGQGGASLNFDKKDCWMVRFSEDNPLSFVYMEKSRLHLVYDRQEEDPIQTESFPANFSNLQVTCIYLDDIQFNDGNLDKEELVLEVKTSLLKQVSDMLLKENLQEVWKFINQYKYICLYNIYAQKALEELDFNSAELAYIETKNFKGLQFLKRIKELDDATKQKAEVLAYYEKYDEAEETYLKAERKDLAIELYKRNGDWFKVMDILKEGVGQDAELQVAFNALGQQFLEKDEFEQASIYFQQSNNYQGLFEAFKRMEDFESLAKMVEEMVQNDQLLITIGEFFEAHGLCEEAVTCYIKCDKIQTAIDCCILLNHWNKAIELAEQYNFLQIEQLLSNYAQDLIKNNKKLEAAELYRKANKNTESATILSEIANDLVERDANPLMIKKLYVMSALEVDLYKNRVFEATMTGQNNTQRTLNTLITSTMNTDTNKILNDPWRGAMSQHFFLLAQRFLYQGLFKNALKCAIRLQDYELVLDPRKIYSLLAIAAYYNNCFQQCSQAFVKLEGLKQLPREEKQRIQQIAIEIFTKHSPVDPPCDMYTCPGKDCKVKITEYQTSCRNCFVIYSPCVATGKSILAKTFIQCKRCKHKMLQSSIEQLELNNCALCHTEIDFKSLEV